jgi:benzoate-CoA ligase family protein
MHTRACRAANAFAAAGVGYETRVALVLPDSPDYLACLLGLLRLGAVPVPLATQLTPSDYARIFADCRPRLAVVDPGRLAAVRPTPGSAGAAEAAWPEQVWVATAPHDEYSGPEPTLRARLPGASDECPIAPVSVDDMAVIQYTSGSTGTPRGVVHLHRGLLAVLGTFPERLGLGRDDICFSAAKLSFGYGFGNSFLFPLAAGAATLLMPETADAARVLRLVSRCRPTVLCAVPALYSAMLTVAERSGTDADLTSVRQYVSAGEPLPARLAERWRQTTDSDIVNGLGSTECLHVFIAAEPGTPPGRCGTVVPGFEAELRDESGQVLGPGETGHLWVRGEANAARYWNNQPATNATMVGGWVRTGDQLSRDSDGVFTFVARSDDILKVGGLKVAPTEIEDCLLRHPAVAECAVVGIPGRHATTEVIAYVRPHDTAHTPGPESETLRRELRNHLRAGLARYKQPRALHLVDTLPRTSTGKIARHALRDAARATASGSTP